MAARKPTKIQVIDHEEEQPETEKKSAAEKRRKVKLVQKEDKAAASAGITVSGADAEFLSEDKAERKTAEKGKISVKRSSARKKAAAGIVVEDESSDEEKTEAEADMPGMAADRLRSASAGRMRSNMDDILSRKGNIVKDLISSSQEAAPVESSGEIAVETVKKRRSIKLYRKIAYLFITLTVVLLAVIFYFSFVKVTITLIPNQERISNNMIIDIIDSDREIETDNTAIKGAVKLVKIEHEKDYPATGEEVIGEEAVGKVTLINNYDKNQPLVATTRLLTLDNKLFRLKDTVNIPAGGSVEVGIYADKPSEDMAVAPTKWSIPGLWAGLQDKIYAENKEPIVYQQKVKKHITEEDIDNSIRDLKQELLAKAKDEVKETYSDYSQIIYQIDENSIASDVAAKAGEEKDEFTATMKAEVGVVAFNDKDASSLAKQKFLASLAENKELVSFNEADIIYTLDKSDAEAGDATVNATFEGKVSLKENSEIVALDKILGLNEEQLDSYLGSLPEIAGYEVKFFPSFIKRVPKLVDRIQVIIKK